MEVCFEPFDERFQVSLLQSETFPSGTVGCSPGGGAGLQAEVNGTAREKRCLIWDSQLTTRGHTGHRDLDGHRANRWRHEKSCAPALGWAPGLNSPHGASSLRGHTDGLLYWL